MPLISSSIDCQLVLTLKADTLNIAYKPLAEILLEF